VLANGPTWYGEVAKGGCSFAGNFSVYKINCTHGGREKTAPNMKRRCRRDSLLAYGLETASAKNRALRYTRGC
jgi:hypothetical protein